MNDERRRLLLARETWRSMHPSETEILRAAKRIASKFPPRKVFGLSRPLRMATGAMATIAGIAYAGSGNWADLTARFGHGGAARATTEEQVASVVTRAADRNSGPHDPKESRVGVVPERLAAEEPMSVSSESVTKVSKKKIAHASLAPRVRRPVAATEVKEQPVVANAADRLESTWADVNAALGSLDY